MGENWRTSEGRREMDTKEVCKDTRGPKKGTEFGVEKRKEENTRKNMSKIFSVLE